ncbi:hypothetical protein G9A89_010558 [Geosiphon pyriformis]|nr:hypothetical protein G9A89_010558 [Geosiphon pyriformis]
MATQPAKFALTTSRSESLTTARKRVLDLYRQWQKSAPEIVANFGLDMPTSAVRAKIRQEFERNRYVDDLGVIDILLLKGHNEYQETINLWKQPIHVYHYFKKDEWDIGRKQRKSFLQRFYEGRD